MSVVIQRAQLHAEDERPHKRLRQDQSEKPSKASASSIISSSYKDSANDIVHRIEQSNCVELASTLFDVYGYTIIMPNLPKFYSGSMPTNDWYDDVYYYVKLDFNGEKLNKTQNELVRSVQQVAISKCGGLTNQQWRCLLCLNIRVDKRHDSTKLKRIHFSEVDRVKRLALDVLDGKQQETVLALVGVLEQCTKK
ncbi:unnamed protein product [Adineta steineri]|uniref:Uncharacterized protein n=1 Tax=Adineta steineri TaxID=433720 RepID=A0A814W6F8_9BILA|nr:unnamed protein product [Adineta steineri]CAF1594928.1 unnamed protein product [Adineta steineri]